MNRFHMIVFFLLHYMAAAIASPVAQHTQDHEQIRNVVADFVKQQTAALPGKTTYKVDEIDRRLALPKCVALEAFLPGGNKLIGKTVVGVRCLSLEVSAKNTEDRSAQTWSMFVTVQIIRNLNLLISTRQLPPGHMLQEQDIASQGVESSQPGAFTNSSQVLGKVLRYGISAGQVLHEDMMRPPYSITQGQAVQLSVQGSRFRIRSEGIALNNASEGQTVQVRVASGRVISGIARDGGTVEIAP